MTTYSNRCCLCLRKEMSDLLTGSTSGGQVIIATDIIKINIILRIEKKTTVGNEKMSQLFTTKSVP